METGSGHLVVFGFSTPAKKNWVSHFRKNILIWTMLQNRSDYHPSLLCEPVIAVASRTHLLIFWENLNDIPALLNIQSSINFQSFSPGYLLSIIFWSMQIFYAAWFFSAQLHFLIFLANNAYQDKGCTYLNLSWCQITQINQNLSSLSWSLLYKKTNMQHASMCAAILIVACNEWKCLLQKKMCSW